MTSLPYDHIVFVSLDCLRSDCVAANPYRLWPRRYPGLRAPATPVLDDLARSGAFFVNVVAAAPYTSSAHATMFTGQYPARHGLHAFYGGRLRSASVFTHARRAGYETVMCVDFPLILGKELGFTDDIGTYLVEDHDKFIDVVAGSERTVAFAHFAGMHIPYGFHNLRFGGDAYRAKLAELEASLPADVPAQADELTETFRDPEDLAALMRYKRAVNHFYRNGQYDVLFQLYLDGIEFFLKQRFEPFLAALTERVHAAGKRMLLVVFGDHGHQFEDDSYGNFNSLEEGVLRVPVIIYGDGVKPGLHHRRIRSADVAPTVLDLAGIKVPWEGMFDGESRAAVVRGDSALSADASASVQAYTADAREFVEFQRQQRDGAAARPLPHVLLGEVAYRGQRRGVRIHYRYTDEMTMLTPVTRGWTDSFDDDLVPHLEENRIRPDLLAMMEDYGRGVGPAPGATAPEEVRQGLRNLGYPI